MTKINEESMRKEFNAKYPEFSTILMLHEEKSICVSGIETIVPRHALANFRAGYEAAQNILSQGEPVGYLRFISNTNIKFIHNLVLKGASPFITPDRKSVV